MQNAILRVAHELERIKLGSLSVCHVLEKEVGVGGYQASYCERGAELCMNERDGDRGIELVLSSLWQSVCGRKERAECPLRNCSPGLARRTRLAARPWAQTLTRHACTRGASRGLPRASSRRPRRPPAAACESGGGCASQDTLGVLLPRRNWGVSLCSPLWRRGHGGPLSRE